MATQLTLALFDDIDPVQQKIAVIGIPEYEPLKVLYPLTELPGVFPADFGSRIVEDLEIGTDSFDPKQIPFEIQGDPNEEL